MLPEPDHQQPFPWEAVMCFGFGRLRLPSEHFWALTPAEIAAAARSFQPHQAEALQSKGLKALLSQYPDEPLIQ